MGFKGLLQFPDPLLSWASHSWNNTACGQRQCVLSLSLHIPGRYDGAEGIQHFRSRQPLLRIQDQQFPDQAHSVFRDPAIPGRDNMW